MTKTKKLKIEVDITKLTLGDLEDLESGKISAVVRVLTEFSGLSTDEVRAIPLPQLREVLDSLNQAVEELRAEAVPFETSEG